MDHKDLQVISLLGLTEYCIIVALIVSAYFMHGPGVNEIALIRIVMIQYSNTIFVY